MKKFLLFPACIFIINIFSEAQVTQINNNKSLSPVALLNPGLAITVSGIDQTLWATDGTLTGTIQLSSTITSEGGVVLNGKYIFSGSTAATGSEIYITNGTVAGTKLVKDIFPGTTGSDPDAGFAVLGNYVYFTAVTAAGGRELWRTDGTAANTTLVKDIVAGPTSSFIKDSSELTSTGNYLLFDVKTAANGIELWRSDGTSANTFILKDINPGAVSSHPGKFYPYKNNQVFFVATDATHGEEIWVTNGSAAGTVLLKDINPGADSSTYIPIEIAPGFNFPYPLFLTFHIFNNRLFFMANDGVHGSAIWVTDGTNANTSLLKVIGTDTVPTSFLTILDAINVPGKFIFPFSNLDDRYELWQSDGTPGGTVLFKSFPANANQNIPFIYRNFSFNEATQTISYPLFNGNFFFSASGAEGNELWISDGTIANTKIVKNINPGTADGITNIASYIYTKQGFYFDANDGTRGNELWKTDGTDGATSIVKDIYPVPGDADPLMSFIVNSKILFTATDGDDANNRDLFVVDGIFNALPVQLLDFTVTPKANDALLQWSTSQEINSKDFTIQSSDDAQHWNNLGTVQAAGNSSSKVDYSFTDINVMNSGKTIVYYRLISTDFDGKTQNSDVISIKLKAENHWNVQLFSNPVRNNLKILLSGINGPAELSVNDISGKTIYKKRIQNQNGLISIPVNLQSGVYILVTNTNKEKKTIKFINE